MDNLCQQKTIIVNACPMCLEAKETIDLLLNCKIAREFESRASVV